MASITSVGIGQISEGEPVRRRWSSLRILGWVFGIVVVLGMVGSIFLSSLCRPRETANRAKCASNLHQIGLAIALYAGENGGKYPPSLATLPRYQPLMPAVMICPSSNDESASAADNAGIVAQLDAAERNLPEHANCLSYIYVGQKLTVDTALATTIVAYEPLTNHQGDGTNVLFGDGHCEWMEKAQWQQLAKAADVLVIQAPATQPTR